MTYIYALFCPIDFSMKYIGKSYDPYRRLKDHMADFRDCPIDRMLWIDELKIKKLKPIVEILDCVEIEKWQFWEEFYIGYFKSLGIPLFNKRAGNGLTYKISTTFRKGNVPHNLGKVKMGNKYI